MIFIKYLSTRKCPRYITESLKINSKAITSYKCLMPQHAAMKYIIH